MKALDFITTARLLVEHPRRGRPLETNLRRAVSTAYYALFHSLAECCADSIAGSRQANRNSDAWLRVYRRLDHGTARMRFRNKTEIRKFPAEVQRFANFFSEMQLRRQLADYAPDAAFEREEIRQRITESEDIIIQFENVSIRRRRAFAIYVIMPPRRT